MNTTSAAFSGGEAAENLALELRKVAFERKNLPTPESPNELLDVLLMDIPSLSHF